MLEAVPRVPKQPEPDSVPKPSEPDSADTAPEIEATEREVVAPPKRARARMISLTLLDGTTISIPSEARKSKPRSMPRRRRRN